MNPTLKTAAKLALSALTLQASTSVFATYNIIPVDCTPGRVDNTCTKPIHAPTHSHEIPTVPTPQITFPLGGVPSQGYWFWGYDFSSADLSQTSLPLFVNRSGTPFLLTLGFTIPSMNCGSGCLPGVEFFSGSGKIGSMIPSLQISGTHASATIGVGPFDSFGWVIGLWMASNPTVTVTADPIGSITLASVGLPDHPDQSATIPGLVSQCTCDDGTQASCMNGDHTSSGLIGQWSNGGIQRLNAWSACQRGGG